MAVHGAGPGPLLGQMTTLEAPGEDHAMPCTLRGAAHLLEMEEPACLMGVLRYHERSRLSAWARPMSGSVVVTCFTISSSASLHALYHDASPFYVLL